MNFVPAKSKQEVVARISALTGNGPEVLGPGSKEQKSVLINLAKGLNLGIDTDCTKHRLGLRIATYLSAEWTSECYSRSQTITLTGLNSLLEAATTFFSNRPGVNSSSPSTPIDEALLIMKTIISNIPSYWDGKKCSTEMKNFQAKNWKQTEWQGWYFEFKSLPALVNDYGGGPIKIGSTAFDYKRNYVWDLKAHSIFTKGGPTKLNRDCQLNDEQSMKLAIGDNGLGLIVLSGEPTYSGMSFTKWHKALRGSPGVPTKELKSAFRPTRLDSFYVKDLAALHNSLDQKIIQPFAQGRQPNRALRPPKYKMDLEKCIGSNLHLAAHVFP